MDRIPTSVVVFAHLAPIGILHPARFLANFARTAPKARPRSRGLSFHNGPVRTAGFCAARWRGYCQSRIPDAPSQSYSPRNAPNHAVSCVPNLHLRSPRCVVLAHVRYSHADWGVDAPPQVDGTGVLASGIRRGGRAYRIRHRCVRSSVRTREERLHLARLDFSGILFIA